MASRSDAARDVRAVFAAVARRYDLANHVLSAGLDHRWRSRAAAALDPRPGATVLDACCGTGDLALAVLRRLGARGRVIGADVSRPMLARARAKLARRRLGRRVTLVEADALALPLADGAVDGAVCGFGLRNLADPDAGLAALARAVRRGGRVVVLEFHRPGGAGARAAAFGLYFRRLLPTLGGWLTARGPYEYLVRTVEGFGPPGLVARRMTRAGLVDVAAEPLVGGMAEVTRGTRPG